MALWGPPSSLVLCTPRDPPPCPAPPGPSPMPCTPWDPPPCPAPPGTLPPCPAPPGTLPRALHPLDPPLCPAHPGTFPRLPRALHPLAPPPCPAPPGPSPVPCTPWTLPRAPHPLDPPPCPAPPQPAPVLLRGVLEQLGQLQRVLADLLHGRQEEAVDGNVDHLLQEATGLEEVSVAALLHQPRQLGAGARVVVAVLGVDGEALLLGRGHRAVRSPVALAPSPGGSGAGGRRPRTPCPLPGEWGPLRHLLCHPLHCPLSPSDPGQEQRALPRPPPVPSALPST